MSKEMMSLVKSYLERTNRPYSVMDIFNNLNSKDNKLSKTAVTKAVEELAAKQKIIEKLNGKQKIYFADQNNFNDIDESQVKQLDQQLEQLTQQLDSHNKSVKQLETKLSSLKSGLTLDQLRQQKTQLENEVRLLQKRYQLIQNRGQDSDPTLNRQVRAERQLLVKEWNKRKRMAVDIIDMVLENYPKPKKVLLEEMGVEPDEQPLPQI